MANVNKTFKLYSQRHLRRRADRDTRNILNARVAEADVSLHDHDDENDMHDHHPRDHHDHDDDIGSTSMTSNYVVQAYDYEHDLGIEGDDEFSCGEDYIVGENVNLFHDQNHENDMNDDHDDYACQSNMIDHANSNCQCHDCTDMTAQPLPGNNKTDYDYHVRNEYNGISMMNSESNDDNEADDHHDLNALPLANVTSDYNNHDNNNNNVSHDSDHHHGDDDLHLHFEGNIEHIDDQVNGNYKPTFFDTTSDDEISELSDSESGDSSDDKKEVPFREKIREWAVNSCIPATHLNALLSILKPHFPSLPVDSRTLLKTPSSYALKEVAGGTYYHFGIIPNITLSLKLNPELLDTNCDQLYLQVFVDGVPLFKSKSAQFWPILGRIQDQDALSTSRPFIIGLFLGDAKPNSSNAFLQDFVSEMSKIQRDGVTFKNKTLSITILNFICDTPARAFVKCTKGHNGYCGCDKCTEIGFHTEHRMTFPGVNACVRTDESFEAQEDDEHHRGTSCLVELGVGMVSQFPLDYMHLICLGAVRKLINLWMRGPLTVRLGARVVQKISDCLLLYRPFVPRDFARKGRKLAEIDRWKATEFRMFLLYSGPVALNGNLPEPFYSHFLVLVVAMTILCSPSMCTEFCDYAKDLLNLFVTQFKELYGEEYIVYNIHASSHLADDVRIYGCVDKFSAFPYENFLNTLKRMLRKPSQPLQQVIRRLTEKNAFAESTLQPNKPVYSWKHKHFAGPLPDGSPQTIKQYKELHSTNFMISTNQGDSVVLVGGDIYQVKNILVDGYGTEPSIVCQKFAHFSSFFDYPVDSQRIGVYFIDELGQTLYNFPVTSVATKLVCLPFKDGYVVSQLNHVSQ